MLLIYSPAAAATAVMLVTSLAAGDAGNGREQLVAGLMFTHFAKRCGETLFVHNYSGSCSAPMAAFIGVFYMLSSLLVLCQQRAVPASVYKDCDTTLIVALTFFIIGQAGNLYHHHLLATLRRPASSTATAVPSTPSTREAVKGSGSAKASDKVLPSSSRYVVPHGGLFDLVTMPHYLFEIVAWAGVALAAQQINAVLVTAGMTSYLAGRAMATTDWYKTRFGEDWPKERRHLVPFIF